MAQDVTLKGGNIGLTDLSAPLDVPFDVGAVITVDLFNGAEFISPLDADHCDDNERIDDPPGYNVDVVFEVDGSEVHRENICMTLDLVDVRVIEFDYVAGPWSEVGSHTISSYMYLPGSDTRSDKLTREVKVIEDTEEEEDGNRDDDGGVELPSGRKSLIQTAIDNPLGTLVVVGTVGALVNQATDFGGD